MARQLHGQLSRAFTLYKDVTLEPGLRAAAEQIASEHLLRMKAQLPQWIQEERSTQQREGGSAGSAEVYFAVNARLLNELAYWHIEPGDADYEKATLEVLVTSPQVCRTGDNANYVDFASRILRIQAMPPARQRAALATESRLLERWGKPRQDALPWPEPLPQDAAMEAIARIRAGGQRPAIALAPAVSWQALSENKSFDSMPRETRCAFQRWWLQESLAQGRPAAALLNAFRYGTLISATGRFGDAFEPQEGSEDPRAPTDGTVYPMLAARFAVSGATTVAREFDAAGKPRRAWVAARKVAVRGIRGLRPIAFEDAFDTVSVQHALRSAAPGKPGTAPPEKIELVWNLPPPEPDEADDPGPKGKK